MKEKVCPVLAIGCIAGLLSQPSLIQHSDISKDLPKCLKEDCQIWVPEYMLCPGHCGLIDK